MYMGQKVADAVSRQGAAELRLGEVAQAHGTIGVHDGRLLSHQPTAGDPHAGLLRVAEHTMSRLAHLSEVVAEVVHRTVVEGDQVAGHVRTLGAPPVETGEVE